MNSGPLVRALLTSRAALVSSARQSSHYKPPASWRPVHLDEMPVPQGPWKAAYESKQKSYNIQLAVGVSFFLFTIGFIASTDVIFFNASIPPLPEAE